MFSVVTVYSHTADSESTYGTFDTEADAYAAIATYGGSGASWARIVRPSTWQEVAARRLNRAEWKRPVWTGEDFWCNRSTEFHQHFAHISTDDAAMIAFTPDAAKGEANRQTRMKPGRYLNRFFPELGAKKIAFLAEWWVSGTRPVVALEGSMALATTGPEIVSVYEADVDISPLAFVKSVPSITTSASIYVVTASVYVVGSAEQTTSFVDVAK